ncbi:MAG: CDC27 family protein [Cytophagaceae bacterium]
MNPDEELISLALNFLKRKEYDQALNTCHRLLKKADNAEAFHIMAFCYFAQDKIQSASESIDKALTLAPQELNYHFTHAQILQKAGKWEESITKFNNILSIDPNKKIAYEFLGNAYLATGNLLSAKKFFELSIRHKFKREILDKLAAVYINLNHTKEGFEFLSNTNDIPADVNNFYKATLLLHMEEYSLVEQMMLPLIEQYPDHYRYKLLLSQCYLQQAKNHEAIKLLSTIKDVNEIVFYELARNYYMLNELELSEIFLKKALSYNTDFTEARLLLSITYETSGNIIAAKEMWNEIKHHLPDASWIDLKTSSLAPPISSSQEEIIRFRNHLKSILKNIDQPNLSGFIKYYPYPPIELNYHGQEDDKEIKVLFAEAYKNLFSQNHFHSVNKPVPVLAFLVTPGHESIFLKCMGGFINQLPETEFEIRIICFGSKAEMLFKDYFNKIKIIKCNREILQAAKEISQLNIDLLYFWEPGLDSLSYFLSLQRLAKVQISSWYPATSGSPHMDYYFSTWVLDPPGNEKYYSEKLIRLDSLPSYFAPKEIKTSVYTKEHFGFTPDDHIYLCHQNLKKIHPDFDSIVGNILREDNHAIVVFINTPFEAVNRNFAERIRKATSAEDRIRIMPYFYNQEEYSGLLSCADVVLDTIYYSGGTTSLDAIMAGVPIVTLPGTQHRSRFTFYLYSKINVTDGVAQTPEEYVSRAVQIAGDKSYRDKLSHRILKAGELLYQNRESVGEFTAAVKKLLASKPLDIKNG